MTETTCESLLETPAGWLRLKATQRALTHIAFVNDEELARGDVGAENDDDLTLAHAVLADARHQLGEYFCGTRTTFDVPVELDGTPFQREVWSALEEIPFGQTRTYGEIAEMLGRPGASRAVGAANGQNPVGIIVPCHRVVGADGSLTGYAGGLGPKRWLLDHEQHHSPGAQMSLLDLG